MIRDILGMVLGSGRSGNPISEIAETFRPNAENQAERDAAQSSAALAQFAAEFNHAQKGWFNRLVDGLNRLPRPLMAFGVIGLFVSAMVDPVWFSSRMAGLALVPEPLWWLLGAVVSFYFGARHQAKGMEFRRSISQSVTMVPQVVENIKALEAIRSDSPGAAAGGEVPENTGNAALDSWKTATDNR